MLQFPSFKPSHTRHPKPVHPKVQPRVQPEVQCRVQYNGQVKELPK